MSARLIEEMVEGDATTERGANLDAENRREALMKGHFKTAFDILSGVSV